MMGRCDDTAICVGFTGANEMLTYNMTGEYACVVMRELKKCRMGWK